MIVDKIAQRCAYRGQVYLSSLYRAMTMAGYCGMLPIGELTSGAHPILADNVYVDSAKENLQIILHSSKTHSKAN